MSGCWAWEDCDTCPFPECYEDNPTEVRRFWDREEARKLKAQGLGTKDIAIKLHKSRRTIERYLKGG